MRRMFLASVFALVAMVAAPPAAIAAPIVGSVDYSGTHTVNGTNFQDSTQFTVNSARVLLSTGDFAASINTDDSLVHASPIVYAPPTFPINPLWTHVASGIYFDLASFFVQNITARTLILRGFGTFYGAGFDPTPGEWVMTLNLARGQVRGTYSASTSTVPEPASLALLGLGLVAVGRVARRRRLLA